MIASTLEVQSDELLYENSPKGRSTSITYIAEILDDCNSKQVRIIEDIVKTTKESLKKNM